MGCSSRDAPRNLAFGSEIERNSENPNEKYQVVVWRRKTITARKIETIFQQRI